MRGKRDIRLEAKGEIISGHPCSGQTVRATARFVRLPKPHFSSGAVSLNAGRNRYRLSSCAHLFCDLVKSVSF